MTDLDPKPRKRLQENPRCDRGTGETVRPRENDTSWTAEPEDEDRRVRPGERSPAGTMP